MNTDFKGPWNTEETKHKQIFITNNSHEYIAIMVNIIDEETNNKNAFLVSAAPDLLEACEEAMKLVYPVSGENEAAIYEKLGKAIAKAKGDL